MKYSLAVFAVSLALLPSCSSPPKQLPADYLSINRDSTVNPGSDFFHYANGGWFKAHPIPESESSNGIFRMISDTIDAQVKNICERSADDSTAERGSAKQKIGDFYASGMDTVAIEMAGIVPLQEEFDRIEAINDIRSLTNTLAHIQRLGASPGYAFYVSQDDKISSKYAGFLWQSGLGLGDRDYYFNTDERTATIRKEYAKHLRIMMALTGEDPSASERSASQIMALETDLAKASRKLEALRDPVKNYNKMSVAALSKMTPDLFWKENLEALGIGSADTVILGQPEFFKALNSLVKVRPLQEWKAYLKWNVINKFASYLSKAFEKQDFYFFRTILNGTTQQKPRWKRTVGETDTYLGELIGQVYVAEYLPKGSKEKLLEIGNNIRAVYADHIRNLSWMSDVTKEKALSKLNKIIMKVGYPDKWKDMSGLEMDRSSYCRNALRANQWYHSYVVAKFGKPVDRSEWGMQPHTYNAYYNASNNEICLPACNVIVPGYEGRLPDDAILYGIVGGSTIGHEITHGFDDQGSQYDENGNLHNWWTKEDREKFVAKTRRIVNQYNGYEILDSMHINGDATQGENIADLGGAVMGFEAFKKTKQFMDNKTISGLTPTQRYFLGFGYAWMVNTRNESLARQVMTDVHSPAQFRINGPLSNIPEFYQAFGIKEGDPMWRADSVRVQIW